jgi:CheY-like chemotaxis protein
VVLPASPDVGSVPGATAPPPAARERARILVVDDEPLVGRAVSSALSAGHDVAVTTSAVEALGRLEAGERFDLVLCDLMMPGMTGMELEARIARGAPDMVDRLVFMTGGAYTSAAQAFLDAGRPYLDKPVDPAALRALVGDRLAAARRG